MIAPSTHSMPSHYLYICLSTRAYNRPMEDSRREEGLLSLRCRITDPVCQACLAALDLHATALNDDTDNTD